METVIPRCFTPPQQHFFLFGPRGTGKSTFLKAVYPDAYYIDLLQPDTLRRYQARPELLIEQVHGNPSASVIIVDEIQKVPELLDAVHKLIEEKSGQQFILTGSSARKLKRSGTDLLAGRALLKHMHPFLLNEGKGQLNFDAALESGLLPLVALSDDSLETLKTYVALYIREEVQYEGLVRNIGNFFRFLEAISFSHASLLNISNVARDCEVERKVVENYISILEDILLASRLKVFSKRAQRAVVSHPKFYLFDVGVFKALRPKGPLDSPQEIDGAALEGLVYQHLRAWNSYQNNPYEIFFWRSRGGVEVDFILYGEQGIYAIEVKNAVRIRPADLKPLIEFKKDYPISKTVLLYRGEERLLRNDILCIPCRDFLERLDPEKPLDDVLK
jgi:predicted AAA+ superfamily ATPase